MPTYTDKTTFNLSQEVAERLTALWEQRTVRQGETPNDLLQQVLKLGIYQLEYRKGSYEKRKQDAKEARAALRIIREAQQDPEKAVMLGLAKRVVMS